MLIRLLILALSYFVTGWLGLQMPFAGSHITLVWLPTGISVAALLVWGYAMWPGVLLAAFLVNMVTGSTVPLATGIAIGNTLAPIVTVYLLKRAGFHSDFDRQKDVATFVWAACVGMLVSALGGSLSLHVFGLLPLSGLLHSGLSWWMGDCVGVLLAAPPLLNVNPKNLQNLKSDRKTLILWLVIAILFAWTSFIYEFDNASRSLPLAFLTLPMFAWAALRFGVLGGGLAGLGFSVVAAIGTAKGLGTFYLSGAQISLFLLWAYMASTVMTGLIITALQAERVRADGVLRANQKHLHQLSQSLQAILNGSNFAIISTTPDGIIHIFNHSAERMLGYAAQDVVGHLNPVIFHDMLEVQERAAALSQELGQVIKPGFDTFVARPRLNNLPDEHDWTYIRKDGSRFPVLLSVTALVGESDANDIIGYLGIAVDLTEHHQQEKRIRDRDEMFRVLYENSGDPHMLYMPNQHFFEGNLAAMKLFGCRDMAEFLQHSPVSTSPEFQPDGQRSDEKDREMGAIAMANGSHSFEWLHQRMDGTLFPAEVLLTRVNIDGKLMFQITVRDISLRKAADEQISQLAFFDSLTGLPNRRLLIDRLGQVLAGSARSGHEGALMFIDLDHFKDLNDTFGHDTGDLLLQQVASRILACLREEDTIARLGGDEFVVLLKDLSCDVEEAAGQAESVGEKILKVLSQPYFIRDYQHQITSSIGITLFNDNKESISELLKRADLAMYQAKAAGRNSLRFFDPAIQALVAARIGLENELRQGLLKNEFILYYQAQVDDACHTVGVEALVRWMQPKRGMVSPATFIPLAEETGLILELGHWVLKTACEQLVVWEKQASMTHLTMAVNVSASQFRTSDYVSQVLAVIAETGADPRKLKLEITESLLLEDVEGLIVKMTELQSCGISFSLDDFGIGYSSLSYIKRLPLNQLKIDQSFVRDILTDQNDAAIVRAIITLGQSLGLNVIAEGVETDSQRQFLFDHQCHAYQGYLFSRPLPVLEFEQFFHKKPELCCV